MDHKPDSRARELCRLGDYRRAARCAIQTAHSLGVLDISLPLSLSKLGRHRVSAKAAIGLIHATKEQLNQAIEVIEQALNHLNPSKEEIDESLRYLAFVKLTPIATAAIASRIKDTEVREYYLERSISTYKYTNHQKTLIQAYIARLRGDLGTSLSLAQELAQLDSKSSDASLLAGSILSMNGHTYYARRYACLVLRNHPKDVKALELLGLCLYKESRWRAARRVFGILYQINKDDISLASTTMLLPKIVINSEDLDLAVNGYEEIASLISSGLSLIGIEASLEKTGVALPWSFYLPYQGSVPVKRDLETACAFIRLSAKDLVEDIASYYKRSIPPPDSSGTRLVNKETKSRKIRIAFISRCFSFHSNLEAHYGLIQNINRNIFHVIIIHRPHTVIDADQEILNDCANQVVYLTDDFGASCRMIHSLRIDILFFTDIGMFPLDSVLTMPHLATIQVTSWGLPHTTGLHEIDYHLRSALFHDCEDQSEYTEELLETKGYFGYFDYNKHKLNPLTRDYFLLPPDRFLVGCLQSLHKIHPEFDDYLEQISKIDPSILIIISPSEDDLIMERFMRRIKKSAPTAYRQMCIVQRTSLSDFFSLNHILDLNLDTIHYGSGISFIQTTWCGPPYVTQRSNFVRAGVVSRSYQFAGIKDPPIASDKQEYIKLVRSLFKDRRRLDLLRLEIHAKCKDSIYNNREYLESCEAAFASMFARSLGNVDC